MHIQPYLTWLTLTFYTCFSFSTQLQQNTDRLVNQVDPNINISALVVDLNTAETLYHRNESRLLIPASNMKLFSDAAALLVLGPDYRFKTELTTDASQLIEGTLHGSLYLSLPGDPSFKTPQLDALLSQLPQWGIQNIKGDIILISSHAQITPHPPGWSEKDLMYAYSAPLAPLMLDENRLTVTVNPNAHTNAPAIIELEPKNNSIIIHNQVNTAAHADRCGLSYQMNTDNELTIKGCIGLSQWAAIQRIAIQNPLRYAQTQIRDRLKKQGIHLEGQIRLGHGPQHAMMLASIRSKPITQLMMDTLKPSDNLYADSLYLHAAHHLAGHPVNWSEAAPLIQSFLQKQTGIPLQNAILVDGSGLSHENRLSAEQTVQLLRYLHTHFPLTYEYIAALPIAGQDGTLQRRLKQPDQQGFIRAKTGTLAGVVSLSGYLYTANAHTLAFALYINKTPQTHPNVSGRYRSLLDTLCAFLLRQKPDNKPVASLSNAHERVSYQQRPPQSEINRIAFNRWRSLEYAIKQSTKGLPVTVLFRHHHIILDDHTHTPDQIWQALMTLKKKYLFSIALESQQAPSSDSLLWIKSPLSDHTRKWTLTADAH